MANLSNPITVTFPVTYLYETLAGTSSSSANFNKVFTRTRSGVSMPQWKAKIKRGENATTAFSGTLQSLREDIPGKFVLTEVSASTGALIQRITTTGQPGVEFGGTSGSSAVADNQALKYLYKAIKDRRTSFQGGVFLGEMREALRMIRSPAKALREGLNDYFRDVKKIPRNVKAKTRSKILAETWLEYAFGWQPLVGDIMAGTEAYIKHKEKILTNRLTRIGNEQSLTIFQANAAGGNHQGVPIVTDRSVVVTTSVMYRVGMRMAGEGASPDVSVMERAGLTLREFIPTVWELVPYSFLVDYFTNIGDILEAGYVNTSDVIWASKTVRSEAVFTRHDRPDVGAGFNNGSVIRVISGNPATNVTVNKTTVRSIPVLGLPSFKLSIPGAASLKWLNIGALVAAKRRG